MKFLKWDKFQHCLGSLLLTLVFYYLIGWWVVLLTFLHGLGKEIWDMLKYFKRYEDYLRGYYFSESYTKQIFGTFRWKDMLANVLGIGLGIIIILIYSWFAQLDKPTFIPHENTNTGIGWASPDSISGLEGLRVFMKSYYIDGVEVSRTTYDKWLKVNTSRQPKGSI